jgi:hypothetical protein
MKLKRIFLLAGGFLLLTNLQAQKIEHMQPVGYQNPFLRSGQFISGLYYYQSERVSDYTNEKSHFGDKNLTFAGYLGLTDFLTLSTRISVYPNQKIQWYTGESTMKRETDFYISPQLTLSYRPAEYLEIFSSLNYYKYTITQGSYTALQPVSILDPETGQIIVEERMVQMEGMDPTDINSYFFKFGLTYSGRLW